MDCKKLKDLNVDKRKLKVVYAFKDEDGVEYVTSGDVAIRCKKAIGQDDIGDKREALLVPVDIDVEKDKFWAERKRALRNAFATPAKISVSIPTDRLRKCLEMVEQPFIRLDFLPDFFVSESEKLDVLDGGAYQETIVKEVSVDGLRIAEFGNKGPSVKVQEGVDSCFITGARKVKAHIVNDETRRNAIDVKRAEEGSIKVARGLKGGKRKQERTAHIEPEKSGSKPSKKKSTKRKR